MNDKPRSGAPLSERLRDIKLIESALVRAVQEALLRHKQAGNPIATSQDGQVIWIAPENIHLGPER